MVLFLAAMQNIPPDLYDAAKIDGANRWHEFRHVTVPGIRPTLVFMFMMVGIWSFLAFEYVWILTQGGPAGSSEMLAVFVYKQAFNRFEAGYAAAIGLTLSFFAMSDSGALWPSASLGLGGIVYAYIKLVTSRTQSTQQSAVQLCGFDPACAAHDRPADCAGLQFGQRQRRNWQKSTGAATGCSTWKIIPPPGYAAILPKPHRTAPSSWS